MINLQALKPGDLLMMLNSTPLGQVCDERSLRKIRQSYGLRIGSPGRIDLLKYTAQLLLDRQPTTEAQPATADLYAKARERLRLQREGLATDSQPGTLTLECEPIPLAPLAPFADQRTGRYTTKGRLNKDMGVARQMIEDPLWPISTELRAKVIECLEVVMETTTDDRSRLAAIRALIAADKLNLGFANLELKEHLGQQQLLEPPAVTPVQVNLQVEQKPKSVFDRMKELEELYANRDSPSEGTAPGQSS